MLPLHQSPYTYTTIKRSNRQIKPEFCNNGSVRTSKTGMGGWQIVRLTLALVLLAVSSAHAAPAEKKLGAFSGLWLTDLGLMELDQTGNEVDGQFALRGVSTIEGTVYSATITDTVRWTLNTAALKAEMGLPWYDARCRQQTVTTVSVKPIAAVAAQRVAA